MLEQIWNESNQLFYVLGFSTFIITMLDDIFNPKQRKKLMWYVTEFLYTSLSIVCGVVACYLLGYNPIFISILMGLFGSSIIKKLKASKDKVSNAVTDKLINTISEVNVNVSIDLTGANTSSTHTDTAEEDVELN